MHICPLHMRSSETTSRFKPQHVSHYILDIALAKCQRATIQNKYYLVILRHRVMFCARYFFFVVKYPRQLEMS